VPQRIAKYQIERLLGEGAFGATYLATDTITDEQVALKIIKDTRLTLTEFRKEAKALLGFSHPNIIKYKDCNYFDVSPGQRVFYIATEVAEEGNLRAKVGKISPEMAVEYAMQILRGLAECHRQHRLHCDLKPDNVLLHHGVAKVADFGICHDSTETVEGHVRGTPLYMAPEQFPPTGRISKRTDIWAIGVMLYEMVYGHVPFRDPVDIRRHSIAPNCSVITQFPGLREVIRTAITKDEKVRYQTAGAFLDALEACCRTVVEDVMKAEQGIIGWDYDGQGHMEKSFEIFFKTPFKSVPLVHASIQKLDINSIDQTIRLQVDVENVTAHSARFRIASWDEASKMWGVKIRWLALGE